MSEQVRDIGSTLRQARDRRGLPLQECADGTRIRSKYLMALEENRFESLPELAYARGFLRTYAASSDSTPAVCSTSLTNSRSPGDGRPAGALHLEAREPPLQAGHTIGSGERRGIGIPLLLVITGAIIAIAVVYFIGTRLI